MSFSQVKRHDFPEGMPRPAPLAALRERIRHIEQPVSHGVLPFGVAAIDCALPGGGLALGAVHEILGQGGDEEDGAAACGFAAGILARLRMGPVLWCLKRPDLYGPGLAEHGLDPARLVIVRAPRDDDILWAIEEGLRTPGLAAVIGEIGRLPMVASRRLQLAAERSGVTALLLRRWRNARDAAAERGRPSAALTRWRVASLASADSGEPGVGRPRWRVELLRCRGGEPAAWTVPPDTGVADATGSLSLSAGLADRPAAPRRDDSGAVPERLAG
ncbi:MAG TPA: damage-inducible protein [Stellaceae bacterium]